MTTLTTLLDQIDSQSLLLPEFQRGYVWNRDQVRGLMRSLYLDYPVGSLLTWETEASGTDTRGSASSGIRNMLLDGQQRLTSLYGVARGRPPEFFEGDASAFTGLHFNVDDQTFEFYAPTKMKGDISWVGVTELLRDGIAPIVSKFYSEGSANFEDRLEHLNRLHNILKREFHLEKITGPDKTIDVVVDIFNRVNSGGTKLSKGDLALAKVTAQSVSARAEMRAAISGWAEAGYWFKLDWLLRNVTTIATNRVQFRELENVDADGFHLALKRARNSVSYLLDVIAGRLGLDHSRVLLGEYGFPVLTRYLADTGGKFASQAEQDKALYWLVHAGIWGRFSGSTETVLAQDLDSLARDGLDGPIENLRRSRGGSLRIDARDFTGNSLGARFYPLLYLLTRVTNARDLVTGVPLRNQLLGHNSSLQVHHIFPKAQLYAMEPPTPRGEVNAVANFALLTQDSNLVIGKRLPREYLAEVESNFPEVIKSQWIPSDPALWELDRFSEFLAARRELLANAANDYLDSLLDGSASADDLPRLDPAAQTPEDSDDPRAAQFADGLAALRTLGLAEPELDVEVPDPETGEVIAVAEAYWPEGLQTGRGSPVVVDVDGSLESLRRLEALGYLVYSSLEPLVAWARHESREDSGELPAD